MGGTNITDYLPRIVLKDRVIMPEEIVSIDIHEMMAWLPMAGYEDHSLNRFNMMQSVSIADARFDRPTGLKDKFENDRVVLKNKAGNIVREGVIVWSRDDCQFQVRCWSDDVEDYVYLMLSKEWEVTGMVPCEANHD